MTQWLLQSKTTTKNGLLGASIWVSGHFGGLDPKSEGARLSPSFYSSFQTLEDIMGLLKQLDSCCPCRRPTLSAGFLALAWPSHSCGMHQVVNKRMGDLFFLSDSKNNKTSLKKKVILWRKYLYIYVIYQNLFCTLR